MTNRRKDLREYCHFFVGTIPDSRFIL